MKTIIFIIAVLVSSSAYAQESMKVIQLKSSNVEAVTNVLDVLKEDKDKKPSDDKMAESIFKRIDVDKNGSLSFKEFQRFYTRIRSGVSDRSRSGRSDRSRRSGGDGSRRKDKGKKDRGPDK